MNRHIILAAIIILLCTCHNESTNDFTTNHMIFYKSGKKHSSHIVKTIDNGIKNGIHKLRYFYDDDTIGKSNEIPTEVYDNKTYTYSVNNNSYQVTKEKSIELDSKDNSSTLQILKLYYDNIDSIDEECYLYYNETYGVFLVENTHWRNYYLLVEPDGLDSLSYRNLLSSLSTHTHWGLKNF